MPIFPKRLDQINQAILDADHSRVFWVIGEVLNYYNLSESCKIFTDQELRDLVCDVLRSHFIMEEGMMRSRLCESYVRHQWEHRRLIALIHSGLIRFDQLEDIIKHHEEDWDHFIKVLR